MKSAPSYAALVIHVALTALAPLVAGCKDTPEKFARSNYKAIIDKITHAPERIVSLSPNITEVLFAVGAGDQVAGVTRYCDHPPEAAELEKVGGFIDISLEKVLMIRPECVMMTANSGNFALYKSLIRRGIPVYYIRVEGTGDILRAVREIGHISGHKAEAKTLAGAIEADMNKLAAGVNKRGDHPRVVIIVGYHPLIAVGGASYINDLVTLAGGRNVLTESPSAYPILSPESLTGLAPEAIIDISTDSGGPSPALMHVFKSTGARYKRFGDPVFVRPGPRFIKAAGVLAAFFSEL